MPATAPSGVSGSPRLSPGTRVYLCGIVLAHTRDASLIVQLTTPDGQPWVPGIAGFPGSRVFASSSDVVLQRPDRVREYADRDQLPLFTPGRFLDVRGFTLIELLVVIAIIAALVAMVAVGLSGTAAAARDKRCQANLSQIARLTVAYLDTNKAQPFLTSFSHFGLDDTATLKCPADRRDTANSYRFMMQAPGGPMIRYETALDLPWSKVYLVQDRFPNHTDRDAAWRNWAMLDGSIVRWYTLGPIP